MKRQIVKIIHKGIYTVIYNSGVSTNPFYIYFESNNKKHLQIRYADFGSCMYWLYDKIGNFEKVEV